MPVIALSAQRRLRHLRDRRTASAPPSSSPSRSRRTSSAPSSTTSSAAASRPRRRPPQARRHAGRQRPRHSGAARQRAGAPARAAAASARCWCATASSRSRTSSTPSPARCTSASSTCAQSAPTASAIGLLPRDFIIRHRMMPLSLDETARLRAGDDQPAGRHRHRRGRACAPSAAWCPVICTRERASTRRSAIYFSSRGKLKDAREDEATGPKTSALAHRRLDHRDRRQPARRRRQHEGVGHPPRAARGRAARALPHRRRAARAARVPQRLQAGIISRIKIMGNMNIAERRLPQDGRTTFETVERRGRRPAPGLDPQPLRREHHDPHPRGRRRCRPPSRRSAWPATTWQRFEKALATPEGGIVICGPTGSRQVHHAVHDARAHQVAGAQGLHGRGPHRAQDHGHHADRGQARLSASRSPRPCARWCAPTPT